MEVIEIDGTTEPEPASESTTVKEEADVKPAVDGIDSGDLQQTAAVAAED